ncbi:hypothetical protein KP509_09G037100 [Ceratopteris richardii]|uniref:Uncharacterized protein n=1 Tax=Ceratopteris richardii TaxID=49495 RepID=A0A8T2U754_CERRI|nr:hypothetical protein KP509_09G037100 [Ceratopteris richardii]
MAGELQGRVAVVTGGSRGIGRRICRTLAEKGASVVVCYQRDSAAASEVVSLICQHSGSASSAVAVQGDASAPPDVSRFFDAAVSAFGHVDIVVHAAAILLTSFPSIENTPLEDRQRIMDVNATGTFLVCQEAAKRVTVGGHGRIITFSSIFAQGVRAGYGAYIASKAAVEALTKVLAKELRGRRITVNCVSPGAVATDMFYAGRSEASLEELRVAPVLERLGRTEDIAPLVSFLASDEGEWVNGQVIRIDGGTVI